MERAVGEAGWWTWNDAMARVLGRMMFGWLLLGAAWPVLAQPMIPFGNLVQPSAPQEGAREEAVAPARANPEPAGDPTVVGNMEHTGWSLSGPRAKHYIFGGLAVADYAWQGKRRIVTLQEQTDFPQPDPNYLYYRELRDGHWWAFRKHPWPDRTYSVWFRPMDKPGSKWQRLQLAVLSLPTK